MKLMTRIREARENDSGFTVVELVISVSILMLVSAILFTIFQSVNATATTVQTGVSNNADTQAFQRKFGDDVRNAQAAKADGYRLDLVLANGQCKSWIFSNAGGVIYSTTGTYRKLFDAKTWKVEIQQVNYAYVNGSYGTFYQPFGQTGNRFTYAFGGYDNGVTTLIKGSATQRVKTTLTSSPCLA